MKSLKLILIVSLMLFSRCIFHPKIERHPFSPMPNLDSLNSANNIIGKHYYLLDSFLYADFNYLNIDRIDSFASQHPENVRQVFNPITGRFKVFQFIAEFNGLAYGNVIKTFHDILIIKINHERKIIDAFQYTLEWGEMPVSIDLYKLSKGNVTLIDKLELNNLEMLANMGHYQDIEKLKDGGIIHLNRH